MAGPSQLGLHLSRASDRAPEGSVAGLLARPPAPFLLAVAALGEMVVDKLPATPDRTEAGPLVARAASGALCGAVVARLNRESAAIGAVLGAVGAVLAAHAGRRARRDLAGAGGIPDLPIALCEDVVAIALARHALRA